MNSPLIKFLIYSLIGATTMAYAAIMGAGKQAVVNWDRFDWIVIFSLPILINLLKDWRSFVDGSYTRYKDAKHEESVTAANQQAQLNAPK